MEAATESKAVDISSMEIPITASIAEINYVLSLLGREPYNSVAGLIGKIKFQAEQHVARITSGAPIEQPAAPAASDTPADLPAAQ